MEDDGHRLHQDRLRLGQRFGQGMKLAHGHGDQLGVRAVKPVHAEDAPVGAEVLPAAQAGGAREAAQEGIEADPLAAVPSLGAAGHPGHRLVPHHESRLPALAQAQEAVEVRAADAGRGHLQQHLSVLHHGIRQVLDLDLLRPDVDQGLHAMDAILSRQKGVRRSWYKRRRGKEWRRP